MAGRPTKLSAEVQAKVIEALAAGNFRQVAADYAGIGLRTMNTWLAEGKKATTGPHAAFRQAVLEAERKAEMRMVALVMRAAATDAKHAEWWLERKQHARWGRKTEQKLDVKSDVNLKGVKLRPEIAARLAELTEEQ